MHSRPVADRWAFAALCVLVLALYGPILVRGHVIYPHDNSFVIGAEPRAADGWRENKKFHDQPVVYVPEIHHHLHGDRTGWLSTWNPHVELGRPSIQLSGFSPAFVITRMLMLATSDARRVYTWLAALTVALLAAFTYAFLRELDLHPWACFAGAAGLATGVFVSYWLTFVMFASGLAWTMAIFWSVARYARTRTFGSLACIAFAVHSLLMTAYPQQIVWHAYLGAFVAAPCVAARLPTAKERVRVGLFVLAACVAGVASVVPAYADLAVQWLRSARTSFDPKFFADVVPRGEGVRALLVQLYDASWFGDPIDERYPRPFTGVSFTPLFAGLVPLALAGDRGRRAWPWVAFLLACAALAVWREGYFFAVRHLGLSLSRFAPMAAALIPASVCAAIALDRLFVRGFERRSLACALFVSVAVVAIVLARTVDTRLDAKEVAWAIGILAIGVALLWTRSPVVLAVAVSAGAFHYGGASFLVRPESSIATSSPLVDAIREATRDGSRYAVVGTQRSELLYPNVEVELGLASVHSYDSLSPRAYQRWTERISTRGTTLQGRYFTRIASPARLDSDEASYAGLGLVASFPAISSPRWERIGAMQGLKLYRPTAPPVLASQLVDYAPEGEGRLAVAGPAGGTASLPILATVLVERHDDFARFETTASERETLFFLSQQHHPHWEARAHGKALETVVVNDFYQGVRLPPGTDEVVLEFKPWVRWIFVSQLAFLLAAIGALLVRSRRARLAH